MSRPLQVLLVDDNPEDRGLVERELRSAYPDVQIAEAIDQLQLDAQINDGAFDLVVTDYHLQWSDGIRVLKAVKKRAPNCPVIMFTATGSEEIAVEAMKLGLDDYIIKTIKHLVRLRGAVQAVLEHAMTQKRANELATRLESLLTQLEVGVFCCTLEGRFLDLNSAMVELLECNLASHVHQKSLKSLFSDDSQAERFLRDVVASRVPREAEIELAAGSEATRVFRLNVRLVAANGGQSRIDGLLEDITRRKQSEADAKQTAIAGAQLAMLSPRETEALQHVVAGRANKVIARRMDISEKTVEKHRASLMKKLRVRSVAELVRLAMLAESAVR
ncbi:MAG: hypothetical protein CMJ50_04055 [Planctomycetaceae bacterium]|nr:hypothetical protein [Planctomycetaceae bacterium]